MAPLSHGDGSTHRARNGPETAVESELAKKDIIFHRGCRNDLE
jgi:hypothetical protein